MKSMESRVGNEGQSAMRIEHARDPRTGQIFEVTITSSTEPTARRSADMTLFGDDLPVTPKPPVDYRQFLEPTGELRGRQETEQQVAVITSPITDRNRTPLDQLLRNSDSNPNRSKSENRKKHITIKWMSKVALRTSSIALAGGYLASTIIHQPTGDRFQSPLEFADTMRNGIESIVDLVDKLSENGPNIQNTEEAQGE